MGNTTLMKWICQPSRLENYIEADGERIMWDTNVLVIFRRRCSMKIKEKTIYEYFSEEEIFGEENLTLKFVCCAENLGMKMSFSVNQTMGSLSGSEKVKTQLMRLFIRDVSVLLLDEPLPMTSTLRRLHY